MTTMLKVAMITVLSTSLTATGWAAPIETATRPGTSPRVPARDVAQAPAPPPAPAAPAAPPAPAPSPRERAQAAREAARVQQRARVFVGRMGPQHKGPWVEVAGDPLTATFSGRNGDVLELTNTMGTVVVSTGRSGEGRIVARRKAGGRTDAEARALLERMQLTVKQHAQRIVVKAEPATEASMFRLDYEVTLPKGMGIDVKNLSGAVTVTNVTGDVRVEAMSGDISAQGLARLRSLRTMAGDIQISGSTLVGEANLQTVSGDVVASGLKAASLTVGSVSGDIQLRDAGCERVQVRTVNGDIEFASPVMGGGRYELKTHAGDIVVVAGVKGAGYEFEAQTFKGRIQSEVEGSAQGQRQVSGRIGNGSAFFELTSFTGDIHIRK
jgi:hypothetical protein